VCSNPIRNLIRVLLLVRTSKCSRPHKSYTACYTLTYLAHSHLHIRSFISCLGLFYVYILRFRLWYLLANGRHPRWGLDSLFLPLKWKAGRERYRTSKNKFLFQIVPLRACFHMPSKAFVSSHKCYFWGKKNATNSQATLAQKFVWAFQSCLPNSPSKWPRRLPCQRLKLPLGMLI